MNLYKVCLKNSSKREQLVLCIDGRENVRLKVYFVAFTSLIIIIFLIVIF